jgi:hypothetical protein
MALSQSGRHELTDDALGNVEAVQPRLFRQHQIVLRILGKLIP